MPADPAEEGGCGRAARQALRQEDPAPDGSRGHRGGRPRGRRRRYVAATLYVEIALRLTFAIMFLATLSFLGLGVQPPTPNWGVMVAENRSLIVTTPLASLVPALAIGLLAIGINLLADALTVQLAGDGRRNGAA